MEKTFFKLIQDQKEFQDNKDASKINIHFSVRGLMNKYCGELNKEIKAITKTEIDLTETGYNIPHLTLAMGYVLDDANFENINLALEKFSSLLTPFTIDSTKPYILTPRNNYIFIDTEQEDFILGIKQKLNLEIKDFLLPMNWDVVGATPHITVAYINDKKEEVEHLVNNKTKPPSWTTEAIGISYCGPRGSCLGSIKNFELTPR